MKYIWLVISDSPESWQTSAYETKEQAEKALRLTKIAYPNNVNTVMKVDFHEKVRV